MFSNPFANQLQTIIESFSIFHTTQTMSLLISFLFPEDIILMFETSDPSNFDPPDRRIDTNLSGQKENLEDTNNTTQLWFLEPLHPKPEIFNERHMSGILNTPSNQIKLH